MQTGNWRDVWLGKWKKALALCPEYWVFREGKMIGTNILPIWPDWPLVEEQMDNTGEQLLSEANAPLPAELTGKEPGAGHKGSFPPIRYNVTDNAAVVLIPQNPSIDAGSGRVAAARPADEGAQKPPRQGPTADEICHNARSSAKAASTYPYPTPIPRSYRYNTLIRDRGIWRLVRSVCLTQNLNPAQLTQEQLEEACVRAVEHTPDIDECIRRWCRGTIKRIRAGEFVVSGRATPLTGEHLDRIDELVGKITLRIDAKITRVDLRRVLVLLLHGALRGPEKTAVLGHWEIGCRIGWCDGSQYDTDRAQIAGRVRNLLNLVRADGKPKLGLIRQSRRGYHLGDKARGSEYELIWPEWGITSIGEVRAIKEEGVDWTPGVESEWNRVEEKEEEPSEADRMWEGFYRFEASRKV